MKTRIYKIIVCLAVTICSFTSTNVVASPLLEQADSAYNAQQFRAALSLYNRVLDTKGASSELYYNIGNANYRLGNIGKAVVAYERALRLDPSNDDARANLEFVKANIKGLPEDGSSFLSNIHKSVVSIMTPDAWSVTAIILFSIVIVCIASYLFVSNPTIRKFSFFGGFAILALFVYAFVVAWQTASAFDDASECVVVRQNARLTSNPGTVKNKDEKTISIPEGSKISIIDSLATPNDPVSVMWYNVELNNNTRAWIAAEDIEKI